MYYIFLTMYVIQLFAAKYGSIRSFNSIQKYSLLNSLLVTFAVSQLACKSMAGSVGIVQH